MNSPSSVLEGVMKWNEERAVWAAANEPRSVQRFKSNARRLREILAGRESAFRNRLAEVMDS